MNSTKKEVIKDILKGLPTGTKIYVKDNESDIGISEAEFVKMNRTRFIAHQKGCRWTFSLGYFIGTCEDIDNNISFQETIENAQNKYKKYNFVKKNLNIKGLNTGDCAVRGIAELLNITWEESMLRLAKTSCITGKMPNNTETIDMLLKQEGFNNINIKNVKIIDFVERIAEENKKYAIHTSSHFTVVKGYDLIDSWDCGNKTIKTILEMEDK